MKTHEMKCCFFHDQAVKTNKTWNNECMGASKTELHASDQKDK